MRTRSFLPLLAAAAAIAGLARCAVGIPELLGSSGADRYTYIVKYSLTGTTGLSANVIYTTDETGAFTAPSAVTAPWSVELPRMTYDYTLPLFTPALNATASLNNGESLTVTISWKDYGVDFAERVLAERTVAITTSGPAPQDLTVYAPELPR